MSDNDSKPSHRTDTRDGSDAPIAAGAQTVEATHKVYGRYSKWFLFLGLALASYIYSLDSHTTPFYLSRALSSLQDRTLRNSTQVLRNSIQVAQSVIIVALKPVIAKFADIVGRGRTYVIVALFYVVGYIVVASAQSTGAVAGGIILYAVGYTGLLLLAQIIIADITTLEWRGLASGLVSLPFVINVFVGWEITTQMIESNPISGWRWGYGMFAILVPVTLSPLIITLLCAERKVKKLGIAKPIQFNLIQTIHAMDLVGLVLIGASVSLILLPLMLADTANGGWSNPSMIGMLVAGVCILPIFGIWDFKYAKYPVIPSQFVKSRAIMGAAFIGFFNFVSFYLPLAYLWSFVGILNEWPAQHLLFFTSTKSVALTVFGIVAGIIMRFTHRYKILAMTGLAIRLLGVGLMIRSRGAQAPTVELVWIQILEGMGGGIAAIATQVGAQASVKHTQVAMVTAVVLLIAEVGGQIGNGIADAIWMNTMPVKLAEHLPFLSQDERDAFFAAPPSVASYPRGHPTREGVIAAYSDVMLIMCIVATALSVVPLILSFLMPNYWLGNKQNAVDHARLDGEYESTQEKGGV